MLDISKNIIIKVKGSGMVSNAAKKYIILLLTAITVTVLAVSFSENNNSPAESNSPFAGGLPKRIISINPAATEIIFALGCEDKLVAVSDFCNYPSQTKDMEKVGGVTGQNLERISILEPDMIIVQGQSEHLADFCNRRNIQCVSVDLRYIDEVYDGIRQVAEFLGAEEKAEELCSTIAAQFREIDRKVSTVKKKKVFFSFFRTPGSLAGITTVGPKTCLSELINLAGGINIFDDVKQDYTVISKETLLKRQPDIIIEPYSFSKDIKTDMPQAVKDWEKLAALNAVKNNKIYFIDPDLVLKPGPRIGQAALKLAALLHPELFSE